MTGALTKTAPELPRQLVALTPADMPAQQQALLTWCDRKIHALGIERSDAVDNARIAAEHGWKADNFIRVVKRIEKQIGYYTKIRAAVDAGFLIVPNFDVEVFAVRVQRARPVQEGADEEGTLRVGTAVAEQLPIGDGRYVGGENLVTVERWTDKDTRPGHEGQTRTRVYERTADFDEVDFPVKAIRPEVLDATGRAMALKIFDRIGVVTGRREDPIVVGQILKPRVTRHDQQWRRADRVSFFIAWWLDPETL